MQLQTDSDSTPSTRITRCHTAILDAKDDAGSDNLVTATSEPRLREQHARRVYELADLPSGFGESDAGTDSLDEPKFHMKGNEQTLLDHGDSPVEVPRPAANNST